MLTSLGVDIMANTKVIHNLLAKCHFFEFLSKSRGETKLLKKKDINEKKKKKARAYKEMLV